MEITFREAGSALVAQITGSIDGLTSEALQAALSGQLQSGTTRSSPISAASTTPAARACVSSSRR